MTDFQWPTNIRFDESEDDIKEARRVWESAHSLTQDAGFLKFMQAYAAEIKYRKRIEANRPRPLSEHSDV
jgi:hypothetical protein